MEAASTPRKKSYYPTTTSTYFLLPEPGPCITAGMFLIVISREISVKSVSSDSSTQQYNPLRFSPPDLPKETKPVSSNTVAKKPQPVVSYPPKPEPVSVHVHHCVEATATKQQPQPAAVSPIKASPLKPAMDISPLVVPSKPISILEEPALSTSKPSATQSAPSANSANVKPFEVQTIAKPLEKNKSIEVDTEKPVREAAADEEGTTVR